MEDVIKLNAVVLDPKDDKLLRVMGLWSLALYGVGDMLGAGIYGLVGKAAGQMGNAVWAAFLASMVAAMLTGLSYASLGSRYPRAAGTAFVMQRAFGRPFLSYLLGLATMASGLTSFAAAARVFSGYLQGMGVALPLEAIALAFVGVMTLINFWGMKEATWLNFFCTFVETAGLLIVVAVGLRFWGSVNYLETPPGVGGLNNGLTAGLALQGAVLTFYSFVGFEDMLNVSEEVKDAERNFPKGLMIAVGITALFYMAISITAVSVIPYGELANSKQPLVDVVRKAAPWFPSGAFSFISLFAVTNTALLNYIMGSRLVYGMANHGLLPKFLGRVHSVRRTPHVAIFALMIIVSVLVLIGDISVLAKSTSLLLLIVFVMMNAALFLLQGRKNEPKGQFEIPRLVPLGGIVICLMMISHSKPAEIKVAAVILFGIAALYFLLRPRLTEEEMKILSD